MKWVLIIILASGAVDHVEFNTELECKVAATSVKTAMTLVYPVVAICVGKSE